MMEKARDPLREEPLKSTTPSQGPVLEKIMSSPNPIPTTEEHMAEETSEMEIEETSEMEIELDKQYLVGIDLEIMEEAC